MPREERDSDRYEARMEFWKTVVAPVACGLESFIWKAVWFALMVKVLFYILERTTF